MASVSRRYLPWLLVGGALVVAALLAGPPSSDQPLDPRSTSPLGAKALVTLLRDLDAKVDVRRGVPSSTHQVALLLVDDLDDDGRNELSRWVDRGGTLVLTDPRSPLAPRLAGDQFGGLTGITTDRGRCTMPALAGIGRVDPVGGALFQVGELDRSCFGDGRTAYVVERAAGNGTIVAIGGAAVFTNGALGTEDNAVLAADLLAPVPGTTVAFLEPPAVGSGSTSLQDLISPNVKRAIVQLAIAFAFYALWRAIRLGKPVSEPQPVQLAGSELVSAVGQLLQQAHSPQRAADILRADLRRALSERLGVPLSAAPDAFTAAIVSRSSLDSDAVRAALAGPPVTGDAELLDLAKSIDAIRQEVLHAAPVRRS
jgi:hypothetical protein